MPRNGTRRGRHKKTLAQLADKHELYEQSVQDPGADVELLDNLFRRYRGRRPMSLREDFCGTAVLSLAWARSHGDRTAVGIDLDEVTLRWGQTHRIAPAGKEIDQRIRLYHANVYDGVGPRSDIVCAMNFSYSVFKTRDALRRYFEVARGRVKRGGLFVLDLWGGTEVMDEDETETEHDGYTYVWEQAAFNPLTHEILCHIHFDFPDGSRMRRAFTYDWRLWTIPELRELLEEAGFTRVHVMWERTDEDNEGTGVYFEPKRVENQECWWTYIVAER